jgi:hypothetical protein
MLRYNDKHLKIFKAILTDDQDWGGHDVRKWWDYVTKKQSCNLPSQRLTRQALKEICHKDSNFTDEECLGAVMAWGGQNRKHGQTLFSRKDEILPIISDMRTSSINHLTAYKTFDDIWQQDKKLGMGAAYFTKLIFFCEPSHRGFIMDQWTSKSTNLLCGEQVIHLQAGHVSKKNNSETFDRFCNVVEDLARRLNTSAEHVEMSMFSKGGRNKAPWRQYVVDKWGNV